MRLRGPLCWPTAVALLLSVGACGAVDDEPTPTTPATPSPTPRRAAAAPPPCDAGLGSPEQTPTCPDDHPETGWLAGLTLEPFRSLSNSSAGKAYAESHDLEFPFSNDYYDAPDGPQHPITLGPDTVCTGIILIDYREPLSDHPVDCSELVAVADHRKLAVAVWRNGSTVVQVSELYRP